jgi:hypothetical protein
VPDLLGPARDVLVHRLRALEQLGIGRHLVQDLAADVVADRDLHLLEPGEDIQLREGERVEPVDARREAQRERVEPAGPAGTARGRAELVADLSQPLADLILELGRIGSAADARGVRLGDAEHVVHRLRTEAAADDRVPRDGVG